MARTSESIKSVSKSVNAFRDMASFQEKLEPIEKFPLIWQERPGGQATIDGD